MKAKPLSVYGMKPLSMYGKEASAKHFLTPKKQKFTTNMFELITIGGCRVSAVCDLHGWAENITARQ